MSISPDELARRHRRLIRLVTVGSAIALVVSWGILIPLKASGPMPAHMTWPVVIVFPPTIFGWLVGTTILTERYPRHPLLVIYGVSFGLVAIVMALTVFCTPGGIHGSADLPWQ